MKSTLFYTNLKEYKEPVHKILSKTDVFQQIPEDWHIVVTDIKGSTASVENGFSETVNLIATGSIVAALNIAAKNTIDLPFFFGGDGATILTPPILLEEIMNALILHKENVQKEFDIFLRVGTIPVSKIYKSKQELKITKVRLNKLLTVPVVLGNGLYFAEKLIKSKDQTPKISIAKKSNLDLKGMECKWNKIPPPENSNEVVSLLINAINETEQAFIFQNILEKTDKIYGSLLTRNPISVPKLKLNLKYQKIKTELKANKQKIGILNFLKIWIVGMLGKYYFLPSKDGTKYLDELTQLSDILVIDGRINMVISGTAKQRKLLTEYLNELERNNQIVYGIHVSTKSIMSCYVQNRNAKHIHFVDGGDSGYTRAAKVLKEKTRTPKAV